MPPEIVNEFRRLLAEGHTRAEACRRSGMSYRSGTNYIRKWEATGQVPGIDPVPFSGQDQLRLREREKAWEEARKGNTNVCPEAQRALEDFGYFQRRYFGRIAVPWQVEAANRVVAFLDSPEKEFVVINAPPGSGKSTTFTLDIAAWITCKNRAIRGLIGSRTDKQAKWYLARLRREFERQAPAKAEAEALRRGEALDAEATMAGDFGRFKPLERDVWSAEQFVVAQPQGVAITEKESTWTAVGMDTNFLGGRFDICLWDDLVDRKVNASIDARENVEGWWDEYAETRLEPAGLLVLQGQRLGPEDLYRYSLNKVSAPLGDDDDDEEVDVTTLPAKYHHVVFRAHYDEVCEGNHRRDSPAYGEPGGCLLYPRRLSWKDLQEVKRNNERTFEILYQQRDTDPRGALVDPIWVKGGKGNDGVEYPGCWDNDRDLAELYPGLTGELVSFAMVDPSPTRFWAITWIVYHPASEQRFFMDLARQKMDAPDFCDWDYNRGCFTGLMEEWQQRSVALNVPISAWIVEANAAQRFMLQYDHVRRWQALHGVDIVPHTTHVNKADPTYGVEAVAPHWRFGRVRLPGKGNARGTMMKLVDEVTKWPHGAYDDCLMSYWFFEWQLPRIFTPGVSEESAQKWTPSWMDGGRGLGR